MSNTPRTMTKEWEDKRRKLLVYPGMEYGGNSEQKWVTELDAERVAHEETRKKLAEVAPPTGGIAACMRLNATLRKERDSLQREVEALRKDKERLESQYAELVDALCSKSWMGRERHASVVGLAKRLRDSQAEIYPTRATPVGAVSYCVRKSGHDGPCNGFPRYDCREAIDRAAFPKESL